MRFILGLAILILVAPLFSCPLALGGEGPEKAALSIGERLSEEDLKTISGRGVVSPPSGDRQGSEANRIILWDESRNPGVISFNESLGTGSSQFITLSVKVR